MARVTSQRVRQAIMAPESDLAADVLPEYLALFDEEGNPIAMSAASGVPPLGNPGQVLTKNTDDSYDMDWLDPTPGTPAGGTDGQVLTKQSAADFDANWEGIPNPTPNIVVHRKLVPASIAVPVGTNTVIDTLNFTLSGTRLCHLLGGSGHSDAPSSHTFDWQVDSLAAFVAGGNNSGSVIQYTIVVNNSGVPAASTGGGTSADWGSGAWMILGSGAHTFKLRATRGSTGGTIQDRRLMVVVHDIAIIDQ